LFCGVPSPVPLAYFKYRDIGLLDNSLSQLVFILSNNISLLEFIERLQFTLSLLERTHWMGSLNFNHDPWAKRQVFSTYLTYNFIFSKAADIVNLLETVDQRCPAYLFKKQIRNICSRFKVVV
jgi:hypothetical protein